jgi:hypothetical protein
MVAGAVVELGRQQLQVGEKEMSGIGPCRKMVISQKGCGATTAEQKQL